MRFTTHFELHFQATRLQRGIYRAECRPHRPCTFYGLWSQSRELRNYTRLGHGLLYTTGPNAAM